MKQPHTAVALLVLMSVAVAVALQAPSPRSQKQENKAKSQNQSAGNGTSVTITSPITQISSPRQEAESERKPQNWHDWFWPPIWSNWALVIAAIVASVAAFRTLGIIKHQTAALEEQVGANKIAARASAEAAVVAREALLLTHRPKLIVRNVTISRHALSTVGDLLYQRTAGRSGIAIKGHITISNVGTTEATIVSVGCEIFRGPLPMVLLSPTGDVEQTHLEPPWELRPGMSIPWNFETVPPEATQEQWKYLEARTIEIYVLGLVRYTDGLGTIRVTRFCRLFDQEKSRFFPVNDPDYEHAD